MRASTEGSGILAQWARFDSKWPFVGDIALTLVIWWVSLEYYTRPEYRDAGTATALVLAAAVLLRRYLTLVAYTAAVLGPIVIRLLDSGLARDPFWDNGVPEGVMPSPFLETLVVGTLMYTVVVRFPRRTTLQFVIPGFALCIASIAVFENKESLSVSLPAWSGVLALFILLGTNVRTGRLRLADLQRRTEQLALERDQREQLAASQERARIAREMHDVVAHSLSVMISLSDGALAALDRNPEAARRALTEAAETGRGALADTRRLLGVLRDDSPSTGDAVLNPNGASSDSYAPQPTEVSLSTLVAQFQTAGLPVTFSETGPPLPDDAGLRLAVYRIVQEALTNVLRYAANSPSIYVRVARSYRDVTIVVENEASPGAAVSAGSGKGLIGMRERVAVYDGSIEAGPTPSGWRIRATMKWSEE